MGRELHTQECVSREGLISCPANPHNENFSVSPRLRVNLNYGCATGHDMTLSPHTPHTPHTFE